MAERLIAELLGWKFAGINSSDDGKRLHVTNEHGRSGLAELGSGIAELVKGNYLVLTDDLSLFGYLQNRGIDAINFNHLRPLAWAS